MPTNDQRALNPQHSGRPDDISLRSALGFLAELHGSITRPVMILTVVGTLAGVAEAGALLSFVRAALMITSDDIAAVDVIGLPLSLSPGRLLVFALLLGVASAGFHVIVARNAALLSFTVGNNARARLIDAFMGAQWGHIAAYREGRLQEAMSRLGDGTTRAAAHLALGVSSVVILIALGIASLLTSPTVSISLLAIPAVALSIAWPAFRRLRRRATSDTHSSRTLSEDTAATATMAREYRTFGVQSEWATELKDTATEYDRGVARTRIAGFTMAFLFKDVAVISLIGVVGLLYLLSDLREGAVIAAVLLIVRMLGYLQQTIRLLQEGSEDAATIGALRTAIHDLETNVERDGSVPIADIGTIRFDGVSFAYDASRLALRDVDLQIEPNTTVGLIGSSGAGKSTVAELLLGLRSPTTGRITVGDPDGGHDLADVHRADWTRLTALVPQDQLLSETTIAENIRFLRDIDDAQLRVAAERAHVDAEIDRLPLGFDHVIGSRSQGLSGGQRQRIAIARALAGRPRLLVLDEPTSALDPGTEQLLRQTLDELHGTMTIVVIAHRPATIEACDIVVRIADGRIAEIAAGPRSSRGSADRI